jgi:hypothetical protein
VAADDHRHRRRERADAPRERVHLVGLESVHRGDPDHGGTRAPNLCRERPAEAEIGERHPMPARLERGRDVLHPERLDAEERSEPEALVRRHGTQQQDVHVSS